MCEQICSLVLALHVVDVSVGHADEVSVGSAETGGLGEHNEKVELLGLLGVNVVTWVTHAGVNGVALVNPNVVREDPNAGEGARNDSKLASNEELSSCGLVVLGEELNEETGSDDQWNVKDQKHDWVVPVDIVVHDQEEVHGDQVDRQDEGEDTNGDNSALNWEAGAA